MYIENDDLKASLEREFPNKKIVAVLDIFYDFKLVDFGNNELMLIGGDGGRFTFKRDEVSVEKAVEAYNQGKRD